MVRRSGQYFDHTSISKSGDAMVVWSKNSNDRKPSAQAG